MRALPIFQIPRHFLNTGKGQVWLLVVAALLFWAIRLSYWSTVEEPPFSDMAGFDHVAHGIASSWNFEWSSFWKTYTTPALVTARTLQILAFGDSMFAWQVLQGVLTFSALLWLAYEVSQTTRSRALALALLFFVALSKSSVFWSLKLSREGFHELTTYALIAAFLLAIRTRKVFAFFTVGLIAAANFLNKPNAILILPVLFFLVAYGYWRGSDATKRQWMPGFNALLACAIGIALLWVPWIARSINIYGEPVLLNTQGAYTVLWEVGEVTVRLQDGRTVRTDVNALQKNAQHDYPDDLAAGKYAREIANAWLRDHIRELPQIAWSRIHRTVHDRTIYLTKVSRHDLFHSPVDRLLLDKHVVTVYLGVIGLFLLGPLFRCWQLHFVPAVVLIPWLSAAMLVGYPRMIEAALPLILFGNVSWLIVGWRWYRRRMVGAQDQTQGAQK